MLVLYNSSIEPVQPIHPEIVAAVEAQLRFAAEEEAAKAAASTRSESYAAPPALPGYGRYWDWRLNTNTQKISNEKLPKLFQTVALPFTQYLLNYLFLDKVSIKQLIYI